MKQEIKDRIEAVMNKALEKFPDVKNGIYTPSQLKSAGEDLGITPSLMSPVFSNIRKVAFARYSFDATVPTKRLAPQSVGVSSPAPTTNPATGVTSVSSDGVYVPQRDPSFVPWGFSTEINTILQSGVFFPIYISGLSGNGKTFMVEQACAKLKREYIKVQISPETDEDDLIGGFRLIKGETVFQKGPVIKAMESGAVLLFDEIDRGTNKMMCLQGILEGNPVLLKKTGEVITPAPGFTIIATANTNGRGSEDGRFSAASIIDDAFLERFTITLEQDYPSPAIEKKILLKHMEKFNCVDNEFQEKLISWSSIIRKTYDEEAIDDLVSTRRLCHIIKTFSVFHDRLKSVELCVSRFEPDVKEAFLDFYSKVDKNAITPDGNPQINF